MLWLIRPAVADGPVHSPALVPADFNPSATDAELIGALQQTVWDCVVDHPHSGVQQR